MYLSVFMYYNLQLIQKKLVGNHINSLLVLEKVIDMMYLKESQFRRINKKLHKFLRDLNKLKQFRNKMNSYIITCDNEIFNIIITFDERFSVNAKIRMNITLYFDDILLIPQSR